MEKTKTFYTDYKTAATWGNCALILCNNIPEIDSSIYDNMRFDYYEKKCPECYSDNIKELKNGYKCNNCKKSFEYPHEESLEIYQWFITDLSEWSVEWQEKTFNLKYTYSDLLDCYILCVTHYGTAWDYVPCEVKSQDWINVNKDKEYNKG